MKPRHTQAYSGTRAPHLSVAVERKAKQGEEAPADEARAAERERSPERGLEIPEPRPF